MGNISTFSPCSITTTFHRFSELPTEVRLKIWHFALPPSQIIAAKAQRSAPIFPTLPRFPTPVLTLMHVSHEVREAVLSTYELLRFPVRIFHCTPFTYQYSLSCPNHTADCWPAPGRGEQRTELERRWESRGYHIVNVRNDLVFFGRWSTRDLQKLYEKDFVPALVFTLCELRYLSLSMQSWKESKAGWLKVLRCLGKLKEVVFVREPLGYSYPAKPHSYQLLELGEVDVAVYEFSGELWKARILMDLEAEKKMWPDWKMPKVEFKAITDQSKRGDEGGVGVFWQPRKLRAGDSWRR